MRIHALPVLALLTACSSSLTTFEGTKPPAPTDGLDTGDVTGDDDDDDDDDDDTTAGDDDDDTTAGDDDDDDTTAGDDDDDDDDDTTTTPGPNTPPVADAGVAQAVYVGETVYLDGLDSYDDDGDTLTYSWVLTEPAGAGYVGLLHDTTPEPQFVATWPGDYLLELTVDDGQDTDTAEVVITAEEPNEQPVANAGVTQRVTVGDIVILDGSNSYDPNNDPLSYEWLIFTKPGGSSATLSDPYAASPSFTADQVGDYEIGLLVDDGTLVSNPAYVTIIAEPEPSTNDGDSCFSCAQANLELERRLTVGDAAGGFGLVLLPLVVLMLHRRDED